MKDRWDCSFLDVLCNTLNMPKTRIVCYSNTTNTIYSNYILRSWLKEI